MSGLAKQLPCHTYRWESRESPTLRCELPFLHKGDHVFVEMAPAPETFGDEQVLAEQYGMGKPPESAREWLRHQIVASELGEGSVSELIEVYAAHVSAQRVEAVERERDAWRRIAEDAVQMTPGPPIILEAPAALLLQRAREAEAEVARLRVALNKYGRHDPACAATALAAYIQDVRQVCACGFEVTLHPDAPTVTETK